jgi:hypothetical protein
MRNRSWWGLLCLLCLPILLGLGLSPLVAAEGGGGPPGEPAAQNPLPAMLQKPPAAPQDANPKRFPDIGEVTKDMSSLEGLFTLYRYDPNDKARDPERLLAKIPKALLGEDLLFAMSISRGEMAGWMWGGDLFHWEVSGNHLTLVVPDQRFVHQQGAPVTDAVQRTYNDSFLAAVPILAMSPQGDVVVDLAALLKTDLAGVAGHVRPDLSTWTKVKSFPDNVLIEVDLAAAGGMGGNLVGVSYSFRRLPKLGSYTPRVADARVGYFLTVKQDWAKKPSERETFDRYVNRWKLEKRDPSLDLSPPKEPIVFIIEKTVPVQWRRWVKEGIEDWNKAFEKIGFTDAVVVQQQTEDNEYANYDPEDARYNFFRWGVSGRAFAVGPSRADPRTGQLLDAGILFDDAFVRAWTYQFDLYGPSGMAEFTGPAYTKWINDNAQFVPEFLREQLKREAQDPERMRWAELDRKLREQGHCACAYASGMQEQLELANYALMATGSGKKQLPERVIGEAIREIVTHEVGHTLGLRHNFKGSAWLTMAEIERRRNQTDEPSVASVMDYSPLLFFAGDELDKVKHFVSPTIGPYDDWAIEYGYSVPKGKSEADLLKEIAGRCTQPELQYATDEDTLWITSPDPLVNRYDLSSNPIEYSKVRIALTDKLLSNILDWAIQPGEPRYYITRAFNTVWFERSRSLQYVARMVGGQYFNRDNQGDTNARPPFVLVSPEDQRAALKFMSETIFADKFFHTDPGLLNMLAPTRWDHWGSSAPDRLDYPIHANIRALQVQPLLAVSAPQVLQRVYDAELKSDAKDRFTAAELINSVVKAIWPQLDREGGSYSDSEPLISSPARNLQRLHLEILLGSIQSSTGSTMTPDLQSMIRLAARDLSEQIGKVTKNSKLDFASRAHLGECKSRIDRVLEAQFQAR